MTSVTDLKVSILNYLALYMAVDERTGLTARELIDKVLGPAIEPHADDRPACAVIEQQWAYALRELLIEEEIRRLSSPADGKLRYWLTGDLRQRVIEHYGLNAGGGVEVTVEVFMAEILTALEGHHGIKKGALRKAILRGPLSDAGLNHLEQARITRTYDVALEQLARNGRVKIDRTTVEVR